MTTGVEPRDRNIGSARIITASRKPVNSFDWKPDARACRQAGVHTNKPSEHCKIIRKRFIRPGSFAVKSQARIEFCGFTPGTSRSSRNSVQARKSKKGRIIISSFGTPAIILSPYCELFHFNFNRNETSTWLSQHQKVACGIEVTTLLFCLKAQWINTSSEVPALRDFNSYALQTR